MVRLNRGGRGRGVPRPPILPRAMRPPEPLNRGIPPFIRPMRGGPRGPLLRPGPPHHIRPLPPMGIPPLPPRPFRPPPPPLHPLHGGRPRPLPPPPPPHVRRLPPGPRLPPPPPPLLPPFPPIRGKFRGALRGSRGVKRLGTRTFARAKKEARRKERAEETESNKPWVTETLKAEIHKKFELYKTAREKKTDSDWQAYKEQRVLVGQMTSAAKLEYIGSHPEADVNKILGEAQVKQ